MLRVDLLTQGSQTRLHSSRLISRLKMSRMMMLTTRRRSVTLEKYKRQRW